MIFNANSIISDEFNVFFVFSAFGIFSRNKPESEFHAVMLKTGDIPFFRRGVCQLLKGSVLTHPGGT